jgi:hypothetical protein
MPAELSCPMLVLASCRGSLNADVRQKNMKLLVTLVGLILSSQIAFAETRVIVVWIDQTKQGAALVTIHSDIKDENKKDLSSSEAANILRHTKNFGSTVSVFILSETTIDTTEYFTLLEGMKDNRYLRLVSIEVSHDRNFSPDAKTFLGAFK